MFVTVCSFPPLSCVSFPLFLFFCVASLSTTYGSWWRWINSTCGSLSSLAQYPGLLSTPCHFISLLLQYCKGHMYGLCSLKILWFRSLCTLGSKSLWAGSRSVSFWINNHLNDCSLPLPHASRNQEKTVTIQCTGQSLTYCSINWKESLLWTPPNIYCWILTSSFFS